MFVESLQALLTTDPGMVNLLGTPAKRTDSTNGVFPVQAPDIPAMPYMVVHQISGEPLSVTYDGTGPLTTERWRLSCYGSTYKNAKVFAKYVRQLLLSWTGVQTIGAANVSGAYVVMEAETAEPFGKGTLFGTHIDFTFVYTDNDVS